jgi:hypothetical protein
MICERALHRLEPSLPLTASLSVHQTHAPKHTRTPTHTTPPPQVPASGPAPVLIRPHEMAFAAPDWELYSAWIENNEQAKKNLGEKDLWMRCCVVSRLRAACLCW